MSYVEKSLLEDLAEEIRDRKELLTGQLDRLDRNKDIWVERLSSYMKDRTALVQQLEDADNLANLLGVSK